MNTEAATKDLIRRLGSGQVWTDEANRYRASMDNLRLSRLPSAVVTPADEEAVSCVLELANRNRVPVTVRGAGSATTGATSPVTGGWVIDLSGWKELHVDPLVQMVYVQPGVTIEAIDQAAAAEGLFFPPDPGSKKYATIGGALATNAGGLRGAKYGVIRDYVLSLEGFLPTGEFVRWGADLRKYVSGFNVRDLWVGSEGMLGVITGAVLRLIPRPATSAVLVASFNSDASALAAVQSLFQARVQPSILEFLDQQTLACTHAFWKNQAPEKLAALPEPLARALTSEPASALLLIEVDGSADAVARDLQRIEDFLSRAGGSCLRAENAEAAETLWTIRRGCSQAMFQLGPDKLNEDIVVPVRSQQALLDYTLALKAETGLATPTFGHAMDGNFHVHIMYDRSDPDQCERARKGIRLLMEKVIELGGAITGEHGIGLAKSPFLELQHSPAEIRAMQAIKNALDPQGILNPDKQFQPCEVWDFPREQVRMPWDH